MKMDPEYDQEQGIRIRAGKNEYKSKAVHKNQKHQF